MRTRLLALLVGSTLTVGVFSFTTTCCFSTAIWREMLKRLLWPSASVTALDVEGRIPERLRG